MRIPIAVLLTLIFTRGVGAEMAAPSQTNPSAKPTVTVALCSTVCAQRASPGLSREAKQLLQACVSARMCAEEYGRSKAQGPPRKDYGS